jgi:hypothetical protein
LPSNSVKTINVFWPKSFLQTKRRQCSTEKANKIRMIPRLTTMEHGITATLTSPSLPKMSSGRLHRRKIVETSLTTSANMMIRPRLNYIMNLSTVGQQKGTTNMTDLIKLSRLGQRRSMRTTSTASTATMVTTTLQNNVRLIALLGTMGVTFAILYRYSCAKKFRMNNDKGQSCGCN